MGIRATDTASLHSRGYPVPGGLTLQGVQGVWAWQAVGSELPMRRPAILSPVAPVGIGEVLCLSCMAFVSSEPLLPSCAAQNSTQGLLPAQCVVETTALLAEVFSSSPPWS